MPVYDKDGNIYKLLDAKPDENIVQWDKVKLHNMSNHKRVVAEDLTIDPDNYQGSVSLIEEKEAEIVQEEIKQTNENELDAYIKHYKDVIWCLPAVIEKTKDEFYNREITRFVYKDKFKFEGIVLSRDDLTFSVWTNIPVYQGSILFPIAKEAKDRVSRWWKVIDSEQQNGGNILKCMPSDYCPDFS